MTTSIERSKIHARDLGEPGFERGTTRPGAGRNVPADPAPQAVRGVLWSAIVARVMLVPVFLVGAVRLQTLVARGLEAGTLRWGLLLTLAVIAGSDMLDGWLARRYGLVSTKGAIADALADKLAQVALVAFFAFSAGPPFASIPVWFFLLVLGRDLLLGCGWLLLRAAGVPFAPVHRIHGRAANAAVFAVLLWLTAGPDTGAFAGLLLLTAAMIWVSLASYLGDAWTAVRLARIGDPSPSALEPSDEHA